MFCIGIRRPTRPYEAKRCFIAAAQHGSVEGELGLALLLEDGPERMQRLMNAAQPQAQWIGVSVLNRALEDFFQVPPAPEPESPQDDALHRELRRLYGEFFPMDFLEKVLTTPVFRAKPPSGKFGGRPKSLCSTWKNAAWSLGAHPRALYELAVAIMPRDPKAGYGYMASAAIHGSSDAWPWLAVLLASGTGVPKDTKRAQWCIKKCKPLSVQDSGQLGPMAQRVGKAYVDGKLGPPNMEEAALYYELTANASRTAEAITFFVNFLVENFRGNEWAMQRIGRYLQWLHRLSPDTWPATIAGYFPKLLDMFDLTPLVTDEKAELLVTDEKAELFMDCITTNMPKELIPACALKLTAVKGKTLSPDVCFRDLSQIILGTP